MPRSSVLDPTTSPGETAAQLEIPRKMFGGIPHLVAPAAFADALTDARWQTTLPYHYLTRIRRALEV